MTTGEAIALARWFMIKVISLRELTLNIIKVIYQKLKANLILKGEKADAFPLRSRGRQDINSHYFYST